MAFITREYKVSINDIDKHAVCTKKSVLKFFETTACEHSDLAGYGIGDIERTKKSWILLQWKVTFYDYPKYGDVVLVKTWARDTDAFTSYRDFILSNKKGKIFAVASSKWAFIDVEKGLIKIGSVIQDNYNPETDCVFEDRTFTKFNAPEGLTDALSYQVLPHDIDVNDHMHNLNYLDLATDALEKFDFGDYKKMQILYKAQVKCGDNLTVKVGSENGQIFAVIYNGEKVSAIIKFYN